VNDKAEQFHQRIMENERSLQAAIPPGVRYISGSFISCHELEKIAALCGCSVDSILGIEHTDTSA
jgi:hypothetical protein